MLPGRLGEVLEPSAAEAQTLATGTPDPCPTVPPEWRPTVPADGLGPDPSECILELPACPINPIRPGLLMRLSVPTNLTRADFGDGVGDRAEPWPEPAPGSYYLYPEFCEDRVALDSSTDPDLQRDCQNLTMGYVVMTIEHTDTGTGTTTRYCRLLTPIECPVFTISGGASFDFAMNRSGSQSCRAVWRRGWTCTSSYEPANRFNTCYERPTLDPTLIHPACGAGAPSFPMGPSAEFLRANPSAPGTPQQQACAEFAGTDFHDAQDCDLDFHFLETVPTNAHWCEYNPGLLRLECHRFPFPADCVGTSAFCIKRASRIGGCDRIDHTAVCRFFYAALARIEDEDPVDTESRDLFLGELRQRGCQTCPDLPFSPTDDPPAYCEDDVASPAGGPLGRILRVGAYLAYSNPACMDVQDAEDLEMNPACRDAPVECADPPSGRIEWESGHFSGLAVVNSPVTVRIVDLPTEVQSDATLGDTALLMLNRDVYTLRRRTRNVHHFTDTIGQDVPAPRLTTFQPADETRRYRSVEERVPLNYAVRAECILAAAPPAFNIIVQELWPDTEEDRDEIRKLFGSGSLSLTPEAIAARGLPTEPEARAAALTLDPVPCYPDGTCVWQPPRPGYFKLTGGGAWILSRSTGRAWWPLPRMYDDDRWGLASYLSARHDQLETLVDEIGPDARAFGLLPGLDGVTTEGIDPPDCAVPPIALSCVSSREWLFSEEATRTTSCPALDVRVACRIRPYGSGNYTETEPVGVIVHEVRVNTVMASR